MRHRRIPPVPGEELPEDAARERVARRTRRSFVVAGAAAAAAGGVWRWLVTRAADDGLPGPLRHVLRFNERLARAAFGVERLSPTFPRDAAERPRANGSEGLDDEEFDPQVWRLQVSGLADGDATLSLADLQALPKREIVTELKCIEGWSTVVRWGGVAFAEFARRYPPRTSSGKPFDAVARPGDMPEYVAMETPDAEYYVGLDSASVLHPQTLLAWEMNGAALEPEHGAPLRLVIPVKYGIKNIKRIGRIAWTEERPPDYWAERGYDWYAGL